MNTIKSIELVILGMVLSAALIAGNWTLAFLIALYTTIIIEFK